MEVVLNGGKILDRFHNSHFYFLEAESGFLHLSQNLE